MNFFYARYRRVVLAAALAAVPLVLYGAGEAWESNTNNILDWLPESFEETQQIYWFDEVFGGDELLMVSWPGCSFGDERLKLFAEKLRQPAGESNTTAEPLFHTVLTGPEVFEQLTAEPLNLGKRQAAKELVGWLLGPDGKTTGAIALVSEAGELDRHAAVEFVYRCADEVPGLGREQLHVAGSTAEIVAIDRVSQEWLPLLASLSFLACLAIMCVCFRSLLLALFIFGTAVFNHYFAMALVYYTGTLMDSILLMVPSLIFVLSVSAGVHLANYYRDTVAEHGLEGAPARAVMLGWTPCLLAAATTAFGLGSLLVSGLVPVKKFGAYASATVMLGSGILFLLLPSMLQQWPPRRWVARIQRDAATGQRPSRWDAFHRVVTATRVPILALTVVLLVAAAWGVSEIRASANIHNMFAADSQILSDYDWLESNIGPLVSMEIVVHFPKPAPHTIVERMRIVDRIEQAIGGADGVDGVGCTISAVSFAPKLPRRSDIGSIVRTAKLNKVLDRRRGDFDSIGYLREDADEEMWRISARVWAGRQLDYAAVLENIERRVGKLVSQLDGWPGIKLTYCGGVPLVHKVQNQLLDDLVQSFLMAFAVIAVAMIVLLRSVSAGLLAMVPNILPCVAVFGAMGWCGIAIEIGSMMTASAALGIAVDDTLHYVTWFRRGLALGQSRREATRFAYERCGTAMVQTSLICGLGLLVFAVSPFGPFARFAWIMSTMLLAALLSDLVVLPAILDSPLGHVFAPRRATAEAPASQPTTTIS